MNNLAGLLPRFTKLLQAYDLVNRPQISIGGWWSSIGAGPTLANPAVDAIGNYLPARIAQALDPGGLINWKFVNFFHNGGVASQFPNDYAAAKTANGGAFDLVIVGPAMNDDQISNWNFGQCKSGYYSALTTAIGLVQGDGADIILVDMPTYAAVTQGPPSDPYTAAGGPTMNWPAIIASPVAAAQLFPTGANYLTTADFVGNGGPEISLPTIKLMLSNIMRGVASQYKVALLPILFPYWAKALQALLVANPTWTMVQAEAAFFSSDGMPVHFNDAANNAAVIPACNDFCSDLRDSFVSASGNFVRGQIAAPDYEVNNSVSTLTPLVIPTVPGEAGALLFTCYQNGIGSFMDIMAYQNDNGTIACDGLAAPVGSTPFTFSTSGNNMIFTPIAGQTMMSASYWPKLIM